MYLQHEGSYKKILDEAIEELKEGKFQDLFEKEKEKFYIKDCALDTDFEILIPEVYVSNIAERLSLYKELNNFTKEEEIVNFEKQLKDRFGELPKVLFGLFDALRLRWLGKEIGFTRIILKSRKLKAFFTTDKNSPYFESTQFSKVLEYLKKNFRYQMTEEIPFLTALKMKTKSLWKLLCASFFKITWTLYRQEKQADLS